MNTSFSKKGLSFGFSSVNAGQRQVVYQPQLIASSTEGGFRITPVISKLLGLESGDNIAFVNNIVDIDNAIRDNHPMIVEFCTEAGLDINSPEAVIAIHKEFDMWGIYKGIQEYDAKGNPKTCTERLTKKDRAKFVLNNYDEMLNAALNSGDEALVAALSVEGITTEQIVDILCPFVQARELPKFSGSKLANPAGLTGVGVTLTFTDSNVWAQLKGDLGDRATKLNRVYDINVEDPDTIQTINVSNGYEKVAVKAIMFGAYTDSAPVERESKKSAETATETSAE